MVRIWSQSFARHVIPLLFFWGGGRDSIFSFIRVPIITVYITVYIMISYIRTGITTAGFIPHIIPMHACMHALDRPASLRLCRGFCGCEGDFIMMKVGQIIYSLPPLQPGSTLQSSVINSLWLLREDTHKKVCFFSDRTTKDVGRVNPPDH